jgi:hypothetical protein
MKILHELKESFSNDELGIINRILFVFIIVLLLVGLSTLSGCTTVPPQPAVPEGPKTVNFDRSLLQNCAPLPRLVGSTDTEVKDFLTATSKVYVDCSTNKGKLNKEVKKAFNIK